MSVLARLLVWVTHRHVYDQIEDVEVVENTGESEMVAIERCACGKVRRPWLGPDLPKGTERKP